MRVFNPIRPRQQMFSTANQASYCKIPELDPAMMIRDVTITWDNAASFPTGLYGAVAMQRKGRVAIGFIYTSTPAENGTFFKEPTEDVLTISAGYYTGGSLVVHSIPLYGCQQRSMSLDIVDNGQGAFTLEGNVAYTFACSDDDNNGISVGGTGNNSTLRPWYHARPAT